MGKDIVTPKKRTLYRYAVDTFIELLSKVQYRTKAYQCNDQDVRAWNSFVDGYGDTSLGKDFIKTYVEYGIHTWFNPDNDEDHKQHVRFAWIFSKKAIERYKVFNPREVKTIIRIGLADVRTTAANVDKFSEVYTTIRPSEERFKKEFHNTKKGLAWCITNTTLYFHKSPLCASCQSRNECKEILKENYNKIYKLRGYDK